MKFAGFIDRFTAKARLMDFANKYAPNRKKLYWDNLEYHEFQNGDFVVGFPDNYADFIIANVPAAASKLYDTWQEARADLIGVPRCRLKS